MFFIFSLFVLFTQHHLDIMFKRTIIKLFHLKNINWFFYYKRGLVSFMQFRFEKYQLTFLLQKRAGLSTFIYAVSIWKISIDFFTTKEGWFKHVHLCSFDLKVIVDRYVPFDYLTTSREAIITLFKKIFLTALFQP